MASSESDAVEWLARSNYGGGDECLDDQTRTCATLLLSMAQPATAQSALDGFEPNVNSTVRAVAIQADGRILIGGDFTEVDGQPRSRLARLLPDGRLDPSFAPAVNSSVGAIYASSARLASHANPLADNVR